MTSASQAWLNIIESGSESNALGALSTSSGLDLDYDHFMAASQKGMGQFLTTALELGGFQHLDLSDAMDIAISEGMNGAAKKIARHANRHELCHALYHANRDWDLSDDMVKFFQKSIDQRIKSAWGGSPSSNLATEWLGRPSSPYKKACEREGMPWWSAGAARPALAWVDEMEESPLWMSRLASAIGRVEEVLLFSGLEFDLIKASIMKLSPDLSALSDFDRFERGFEVAKFYLPQVIKGIGDARKSKSSKPIVELAKKLGAGGAGPWIPLMLAWADHSGFFKSDRKVLAPLIEQAIIDRTNVGLVAQNYNYGSFNARMAGVVEAMRLAGRIEPGAMVVLGTYISEMKSEPRAWQAMRKHNAFFDELEQLATPLLAEAERCDIEKSVGLADARLEKNSFRI